MCVCNVRERERKRERERERERNSRTSVDAASVLCAASQGAGPELEDGL